MCEKSVFADWPLQIKLFVLKSVLTIVEKREQETGQKSKGIKYLHNFIEIKVSTGVNPHLLLDCSDLNCHSEESNGRSKTRYHYK